MEIGVSGKKKFIKFAVEPILYPMKHIKTVFAAILLILIIIFSFQNMEVTNLKLFSWSVQMPVAIYIIVFYILGMLTGGMLFSLLRQLFEQAAGDRRDSEGHSGHSGSDGEGY
jgi:lipopolysaccharide assembly protein A